MTILLRPELQRFIDEQVRLGAFPSAEALVEAAISHMQDAQESLDAETIAAINEAEEEADRGEGVELGVFRTEMKQRYGIS